MARFNVWKGMPRTAKGWLRTAWAIGLVWAGCLAGCNEPPVERKGPVPAESGGGGSGGEGGSGGSGAGCEDGDVRSCHVDLGTHNGITSCFDGEQTCVGGEWGVCSEPVEDGEAAPPPTPAGESASLPVRARGVAGERASLPVRARGAVEAEGVLPGLPEWEVGGQIPFSETGATACPGNSCDPGCRRFHEEPPGGIRPSEKARTFAWTAGSVGDVPPETLALGVREPCHDAGDCQFNQLCSRPASGTCAHSKCDVSPGLGLAASCDPCVAAICDVEPACCDSAAGWTESCVAKVADVCGAVCGAGDCGESCPPEGQCISWPAGQKWDGCIGLDLTAGVTCSAGGEVVLPVCNHGALEAPAGVLIAVFPAGSKQIPAVTPAMGEATLCKTQVPIAPGECVEVTGCGGLSGGEEVMVNPPGQAGSVAECHEDNNWTVAVAEPAACAAPSCVGDSASTTLKKTNLFFAIDRSNSMLTTSPGIAGNPTRWAQMVAALTAFVQAPSSAGLGVWVRFWPYNKASSCPGIYPWGCQSSGCAIPNVPLGDLTAAPAPADTQEAAVLEALAAATPELGSTPMYPALKGVTEAATSYQLAHPGEIAVVVLLTDGEPTQCDTLPAHIAALAESAHLAAGVRTYVIGIADVSVSTIETIASAGGGEHFFVAPGSAVPVEEQVLGALNQVRTALTACSFHLPEASVFASESMAVTFWPSSGGSVSYPEVAGAEGCGAGGGWYYDEPETPGVLSLCPASCAEVRADAKGKLTLKADCSPEVQSMSLQKSYEATCPAGTHPVWLHLAYDAEAPADSHVEMWVATGEDDDFDDSAPVLVADANEEDGTAYCGMGGPAPCPVDLPAKLGSPADKASRLQLTSHLFPSSDRTVGPTLNGWTVTYSCFDAE